MFGPHFVVKRLRVCENCGVPRFDLQALDSHTHVHDIALSTLGHSHPDDIVLPCKMIAYHGANTVWWCRDVGIQILRESVTRIVQY